MANFDVDDPLGDLLSGGSDDSFFDEPKPAAKRGSISKSPDKKSVTDLFGLKEDKADDWLGLDTNTKRTPTAKRNERVQKKISFEEDTDILNTLGLEGNKKTEMKKSESSKKSSLMESILGPPKEEDKKFMSLDDLLKESKAKKQEIPAEVSQSTSHLPTKPEIASNFGLTSLDTPKESSTSIYGLTSLDAPREGRRGRPKTANIADPLSLFSDTKPKEEPEIKPRRRTLTPQRDETKEVEAEVLFQAKPKLQTQPQSDVPGWLGGNSNTQSRENVAIAKTEEQRVEPKVELLTANQPTVTIRGDQSTVHLTQTMPIDSLLTQQKLAASQIEYQNTSIALQQQESQVLVALQLRKYEENMAEMQRKQQEILVKQEQQFNHLLERQFAKQNIMENNMRLQQERINNHIQLLITQPSVRSIGSVEEIEKYEEIKKVHSEDGVKHFEDIINALKQRQHEEMFLLEESYKKQLSTIEQSMESIENHLKTELDTLTQKSREKLEHLETDYESEIAKYKKKIEDIYLLHDHEMKQQRENNNRVLEEVKYEYNTIIENLKMSKHTEQGVLQEANAYSEKLDASLKLLDINSRSLLDIRQKVETDYGVLSLAREESLKAKQEEINLMRLALEKAREEADNERSQLMSLVRNLEIKLAEQSHNAREDRFALQQASSMLTARAVALEREADFNRSSLEREREQLKTLRENILSEQEKAIQQITEEKLALHVEKTRLETSAKLTQNYDSQKHKAEMEAAMDVAKEAAELTDRERENLLRQLRDVESLKRSLADRESKMNSRERDLDVAMEQATRKHLLGEKSLEEARNLQVNYNERLREIQMQMSSLAMRERKLAEEKISLSRERVALNNATRAIKKCSLCAVDNIPKLDEEDNISEPVEQDLPRFISMTDADYFRLQLQISEDQLTSNQGDDRISTN